MFKNFKVKGPADKLLIYLTCFIQKCLEEIRMHNYEEDKARTVVGMIIKESVSSSE